MIFYNNNRLINIILLFTQLLYTFDPILILKIHSNISKYIKLTIIYIYIFDDCIQLVHPNYCPYYFIYFRCV